MAPRAIATGGRSASSAGFAGAISGLLASDARGPARGRPPARTASWGEVRKGGEAPLRVRETGHRALRRRRRPRGGGGQERLAPGGRASGAGVGGAAAAV